MFHANGNQKKAEAAILISDKIDVKIKTVTRDKKGRDIIIRGSIQEDKNCKYLCTQHRSTLILKANLNSHKGEINSNTTIVGDFNTPLSPMDR